MVPDGRTEWTDGRTEGRTYDAKTISLRLRLGIINHLDQTGWQEMTSFKIQASSNPMQILVNLKQ